jgi:RNA polymerase sigma-70 factor (ECF subfamily)
MTDESDRDQRAQLFAVAYRMLGSSHDAEDAVHESLARWHQLTDDQRGQVREPTAWLTKVVSRICLDQLKSARVRREQYRGIWLPEPRLGAGDRLGGQPTVDPADAVSMDESVAFAFLVALEKLTPAERVTFVLHDVFGVAFAEIAETVGRTPGACRQLAVSARKNLAAEPRFDVPSADRDKIVEAFLDACRGGELPRLVAVLDPHVVSAADGGELVNTARRSIVGAEEVATYLIGVIRAQRKRLVDPRFELTTINGRTGIAIHDGRRLAGTIELAVTDGLITRIAIQVNTGKLP